MAMIRVLAGSLVLLGVASDGFTRSDDVTPGASSDVAVVTANDNRVPAGVLKNDTLRLQLVVQTARWYPEAPHGQFVDVAAIAEQGKAPQIPAPLIRVTTGTTIVASIANTLPDSILWVRGMITRPGSPDSVPVKPGESRTFTFSAGAPGTYSYGATPGVIRRTEVERDRTVERETLSGAFVIDPVGAKTDDRIFVVNVWGQRVDAHTYRNALAINGKSWPHTERVTATVGDSVHWRVVNGSARRHPMHMHGFYFRVDSRGNFASDTTYSADAQRLAVTEDMAPGTTMSMVWSPDRPGNWLFHCHVAFHVTDRARLDGSGEEHAVHDTDPMKHMSGLVIGMKVKPRKGETAAAVDWEKGGNVRKLRLFANERPRKGPTPLAMSYVLQRDARIPAIDSVEPPGQPIVLVRGEPTQITVVNRAHDGTSVHWHGIELESYSDGVAGWSGMDKLAPMVAPNDSFIARLTLPRAGTFIYHTHLNDIEQITSGMYGPILVLEPGEVFDPTRDHVFTFGWDGPRLPINLVINGDSVAPPLVLDFAKTHRVRFVNIGPAARFIVALRRDSTLATWRPIAKDGADLPAASRKPTRAITAMNVGETFDAELVSLARGEYTLTVGPPIEQRLRTRRIIVR
jgi:FtsP/CotA-like multicopper oxidase with cupredoxin domain